MTYKEKYTELYNTYEEKTNQLREALELIAFTDGFGDMQDLPFYYKAQREQQLAERNFQTLLKYISASGLNPSSEYVDSHYMYNFIKKDQESKGVTWEGNSPRVPEDVPFFECVIGLTNDETIKKPFQSTEYKFPVISLDHGKECMTYLVEMLEEDYAFKDKVDTLKFKNVHDSNKQIYVRVEIRTS